MMQFEYKTYPRQICTRDKFGWALDITIKVAMRHKFRKFMYVSQLGKLSKQKRDDKLAKLTTPCAQNKRNVST